MCDTNKDSSVKEVLNTIKEGLASDRIGEVIQVKDEMTLSLGEDGELSEGNNAEEEQEVKKEKRIGAYKVNKKYVEFIYGKSEINFTFDHAFIEGKYLAGLGMDNVTFKFTICDDNTVDFDEVDTQTTTFEQRERLLEIITEKKTVSYRQRWCIGELPFTNKLTSDGKEVNCYLVVEQTKPIDKLYDIFMEEPVATEEQASKLDSLLDLLGDDEEVVVEQTTPVVDQTTTSTDVTMEKESEDLTKNYLEESFKKMNQDKIDELKKRIENKQKDVAKYTQEHAYSQKRLDETIADLSTLEVRLDTMTPSDPPNGYFFNVSEEVNERIDLDEQTTELIRKKVSQIKSINVEAFMKLFNAGEFRLRLAIKNEDGSITEITDYNTLPKEIIEKIATIGFRNADGESLQSGVTSLTYRGEFTWHQLLYKLMKAGFEQEPEFDKVCESSSYGSKDPKTNNIPHSRLNNGDNGNDGGNGNDNHGEDSDDDDYENMCKIKPNDAEFAVTNDSSSFGNGIVLWVSSISHPDYDDIREVDHVDFEKYWGNAMENVFEAHEQDYIDSEKYGVKAFKNTQEAIDWCISIGMVHNQSLAYQVGG